MNRGKQGGFGEYTYVPGDKEKAGEKDEQRVGKTCKNNTVKWVN